MSVLKKFNISFVLLLALLFNLSFAGTITINQQEFNTPYITGDYSVTCSGDYIMTYLDNVTLGNCYILTFFDTFSTEDIVSFGVMDTTFAGQSAHGVYAIKQNNSGYYRGQVSDSQLIFRTNGTINFQGSGSSVVLTSADFPYTVIDYGHETSSNGNILLYYNTLEIFHSGLNVYETTLSNDPYVSLGNLVYGSDVNPISSPFVTSLQWQDINDEMLELFDSETIRNQLPSDFSKIFVIYYEDLDYYQPYFFQKSYNPTGYIYYDNNSKTYKISFHGSPATWPYTYDDMFRNTTVYTFFKNGTSEPYSSFSTISVSDLEGQTFDFVTQPVVYSNFDFKFYSVYDDVISSVPDFVLSYNDIINGSGQIITPQGVLDEPKDDNSIWSMLFNIFNPNYNTQYFTDVENQHNDIISSMNNDEFKYQYTTNNSLISNILSLAWLTTASQLLFEYFSGFLILCCIFITIGRVMKG